VTPVFYTAWSCGKSDKMDEFDLGNLTSAGRIQLEDEETQVAHAVEVKLVDREYQPLPIPGSKVGQAAATTHHLWWWTSEQTAAGNHAVKLGLHRILKAEVHNSIFRRSPRVDLYFAKDPSAPLVRLVFAHKRDAGVFHERLEISIQRQSWKIKKKVVHRESGFSTQYAGVGGVMRRQEQEREQTKALANEAFSDLSALLTSASEIVGLADRFSEAVKRKKASSSGEGGQEDEDEFFSILNDMGIANPATKKACGAKFHQELARELADFLGIHLKQHAQSGVIALTDLYCMVNRARGTQLISPNDLYQACTLMQPLGLAFSLKTFDSGVSVLQAQSLDDDQLARKVLDMLAEKEKEAAPQATRPYLTALQLSQANTASLQLALEQLKTVERMGLLCRDETEHGLAFYRNLFPQWID